MSNLLHADNIWLNKVSSSEVSFQSFCVDTVLDALFNSMGLEKHLARTRLPTDAGYEEVLEPDYYRDIGGLVAVVAEVKLPHIAESSTDTIGMSCD